MELKSDALILLVEDNPADIDLIRYTFKKNKIENRLEVIEDGERALDYILKRNGYEGAEKPDLIILDINLPRMNGLEILQIIKEEEISRKIPVVMLTTSSEVGDIETAYEHRANAYLVKPVEIHDFIDIITKLEEFMIRVIRRPGK